MARIFLYVFAGIIALVLVALTLLNVFQDQLTEWALAQTVPSRAFAEVAPPPAPDYATPAAWAARPDDPGTAALVPEGVVDIAMMPRADVFFIHPTTYGISPGEHGGRDALYWNAPIDDPVAGDRIDHGILKYQASAFNLAGRIHAPHYRQATFGVFFDTSDARRQALSLAYQDVQRAFDRYIAHDNAGRPFILAGHSQGALHALLLLQERIAGTPLAERMVAAYVVGWPVSVEADLGALDGIDACDSPRDTGCVVSWLSFGADGDPSSIKADFAAGPGLNGQPRAGTAILCTNPLSWTTSGDAIDRQDNPGAVPFATSEEPIGAPIAGLTGARCEDGILYLDPSPGAPFTQYLFPGEDYHVYDYGLFYMSVRDNAALRTNAFLDAAGAG